jgi:hypothetical protein
MPNDLSFVASVLDAAHASAKAALEAKNLEAYMGFFAENLTYESTGGACIGRTELTRDVARYLDRIESVRTEYVREDLKFHDNEAVELLRQDATVTVIVFLLFRRRWTLKRRGVYTWIKTTDGWKIRAVKVIEESVS